MCSWKARLAVYEGQEAGLDPHLSRGQAGEGRGAGAHQISRIEPSYPWRWVRTDGQT